MSLATAGIDCTVSPPLLGAMEDCSIVRGPQLQRLCRQNCYMSGQRRMFVLFHLCSHKWYRVGLFLGQFTFVI